MINMKQESIYNVANQKLQDFVNNDILDYERQRNYDLGVKNRKNVSNLSKYVSHRIISEYEIISCVLKKYKLRQVEKYIQEVFWRIYWKGWLENRPKVWSDFVKDCSDIKKHIGVDEAILGKTKINCFNEWVHEIKEYNYLHNHTRMWFASIWIFTLKLPWQLGAKFFYENLFDGDAASNTLSWRWVAGLQTRGKNYLAKSWNIQKFTNNRLSAKNLNESALPLDEFTEYKLEENITNFSKFNKSTDLIIFENDLFLRDRMKLFESYKNIYLVLLDNKLRKFPISLKVYDFKKSLCEDFCSQISNCQIIENIENQIFDELEECDVIYPFVGENLDFIKEFSKKKSLKINYIERKEDNYCKQFSKKGFFNFKNNIVKIIDHLGLNINK